MAPFTLPWPGQPAAGSAPVSQVVRDNMTAIAVFLNALDGGNLLAGTVTSAAFDTNTNPVTRWKEGFADFIASGGMPGGFAGLAVTAPSGVAYTVGIRTAFGSQGLTAVINSDCYAYVTSTGSIAFTNVANNAAPPSLPANSQWLFKAITNASAITSLVDLRVQHAVTPGVIHNPYKFKAVPTSDYTNSNVAKVTLGTKTFDTNNNFDATTNYRYTIPVTGYYQFHAAVQQTSVAGGGTFYACQIKKNGSTIIAHSGEVDTYGSSFEHTYFCSAFEPMTAGDYIELFAVGGATNTLGAAGTFLSGYLACAT